MTLIVGIKCSDGVVIGADGAATLGGTGYETIKEPINKLEIIPPNIILGVSGSVGLSQKFTCEIEARHGKERWHNKDFLELNNALRDAFWPHIANEFKAAKETIPILGNSVASRYVISQTLIGIPLKDDNAHLIQLNHQCSTEEATEKLPYVSIGSGQSIADPFLAFLKRIFWEGIIPNLSEGVFVTLWTLQHAILTSPGGVAGPTQITRLFKNDRENWQADFVEENELTEHKQAIASAEAKLRDFKNGIVNITEKEAAKLISASN